MRATKFINHLIEIEGGYVNDPDDSGGETKYGISKKSYPNEDIKNLTIERATEIYKEDFYDKMNIEYIKDEELAWQVFDMGVNAGTGTAAVLLQAIVDCKTDGAIGPKTLRKTNHYLKETYQDNRRMYYVRITNKTPKFKKFINGWINRIYKTI